MRILIAAGGTGGHINPGITVSDAIKKRWPESEILFVCSKRDIEERIYKRKGLSFKKIDAEGIRGGIFFKIVFAIKFFLSLFESFFIVKTFRPDIVLGMGGYVSAPPVIAARVFGIPAALHEQNSIPGKANRLSSRFASVVMTGFESSASYFKKIKTVFTGNPIRRGILSAKQEEAYKRFGLSKDLFTVLIIGGSQGAVGLNRLAVGALTVLKKMEADFQVIHMAGKAKDEVASAYTAQNISARCETYFDEIGLAYVIADLVISRCGAMAIAEIAAFGKPSILVPYPHSADDHQTANGKYLSDKGAAVMLREDSLTGQLLAEEIFSFYNDREKLKMFGKKSAILALKGVEEKILNTLTDILVTKKV